MSLSYPGQSSYCQATAGNVYGAIIALGRYSQGDPNNPNLLKQFAQFASGRNYILQAFKGNKVGTGDLNYHTFANTPAGIGSMIQTMPASEVTKLASILRSNVPFRNLIQGRLVYHLLSSDWTAAALF